MCEGKVPLADIVASHLRDLQLLPMYDLIASQHKYKGNNLSHIRNTYANKVTLFIGNGSIVGPILPCHSLRAPRCRSTFFVLPTILSRPIHAVKASRLSSLKTGINIQAYQAVLLPPGYCLRLTLLDSRCSAYEVWLTLQCTRSVLIWGGLVCLRDAFFSVFICIYQRWLKIGTSHNEILLLCQ